MREMTHDEVKKTQLEILDVVMKFCEECGINCWLDFGTLIGAVRHKGYIPWDDDIDLSMLRPDYDKFMAEFNGYNPRYSFHCIENDPEFEFAFGKVFDNDTVLDEPITNAKGLSVNIDIFVLDNAPNDDRIFRDMIKKRDYYVRVINCLREGPLGSKRGSVLRRVIVNAVRVMWMISHFFPPSTKRFDYVRKIVENAKRYANKDTGKIGNFVGEERITCDKSVFTSFTEAEFEGSKYKIPARYDEWLTLVFGDYMTPPPPEQRVSRHVYKAYKKD